MELNGNKGIIRPKFDCMFSHLHKLKDEVKIFIQIQKNKNLHDTFSEEKSQHKLVNLDFLKQLTT